MGNYKRFSKKLCGVELVDNPDKYGPDLVRTDGGGFVECEIKKVWKTDEFPYGSVQFPERKAKYVYQNKDTKVEFFMLNMKCNRALTVDGQDILDSKLSHVRNIYVNSGELFFQVPLEKVTFFSLQDDQK
jgi:hypothetical protein